MAGPENLRSLCVRGKSDRVVVVWSLEFQSDMKQALAIYRAVNGSDGE